MPLRGESMHCLAVIPAPVDRAPGGNVELEEFATFPTHLQPGRVARARCPRHAQESSSISCDSAEFTRSGSIVAPRSKRSITRGSMQLLRAIVGVFPSTSAAASAACLIALARALA